VPAATIARADPGRPPRLGSSSPCLVPAFKLINEGAATSARRDALWPRRGRRRIRSSSRSASASTEQLYAQAREHFLRAIELAPLEPSHHFLGFAEYNLGDLPAARRAFEAHRRCARRGMTTSDGQ
jgi:hypothetical protein